MQAQPPESPDDAEPDALFAGTELEIEAESVLERHADCDFELPVFSEITGVASDSWFETSADISSSKQLLLIVSVSIALHIGLLLLLRQLSFADPAANNIALQSPSIQIIFRPRPAALPDPVEQIEAPLPETIPQDPPQAIEDMPAEQPFPQAITDQPAEDINPEPPPEAPRLLAPALQDVRDLIQSRAKNHATARIYNNINCDERQRRTDLIDCGDDDPNARYNFAAAEQNATVEFFADLNRSPEEAGNPPADRTTGDARTRASLNNMTGNLGANPLIRSVMGQP